MLLPERVVKLEKVALMMELWDMLQTCRFEDFWALTNKNRDLYIPGFEAAIRRFVVSTVSLTFRKEIAAATLCKYLGVASAKDLGAVGLSANEQGVVELASLPDAAAVSSRPAAAEFQLSQLTDLILAVEKKPGNARPLGAVSRGAAEAVERMSKSVNAA
jgi:hypothetical protein